jgi:hypothetical protein
MVFVSTIDKIDKDVGFVYLLLKNLSAIVHNGFINENLICDTLRSYFEEHNDGLEGRVLSILGAMKVKNIDFWLYCEDLYASKLLHKEEIFKVIEALIGLASVHRGTIALNLAL